MNAFVALAAADDVQECCDEYYGAKHGINNAKMSVSSHSSSSKYLFESAPDMPESHKIKSPPSKLPRKEDGVKCVCLLAAKLQLGLI